MKPMHTLKIHCKAAQTVVLENSVTRIGPQVRQRRSLTFSSIIKCTKTNNSSLQTEQN